MTKTAAELLASGDIEGLLAFQRARFGDLRMEDTPPAPPAPATPPAPAPDSVPQDQVNAIVARTKRETEAEVRKQVAETLGVDVAEAAKLIKASKDAEAAKMSEAEKREQAAAEKERLATERENAAGERERKAIIRTALVVAGCADKDDQADAEALVRIDGDTTDESAADAVAKLKERRPELFKGVVKTPPPPGAPPAPPGTPPGRSGGPSRMSELRQKYREELQPQTKAG